MWDSSRPSAPRRYRSCVCGWFSILLAANVMSEWHTDSLLYGPSTPGQWIHRKPVKSSQYSSGTSLRGILSTFFQLDHHTAPRYILTNIMDGIQNPKDFSGIKDDIGSFECVGNPFWEESANFITLATRVMISAEGMKAAKEAEAMDIELSCNSTKNRRENQSGSMYGNNKRKQPALSLLWLEKRLRTMHILFTSMTSNMLQWRTDIARWAGCLRC